MSARYRKIDITADTLLGCRFFDGLDRDERTKVIRLCEGRVYPAGEELIRHGDDTRDVFFILSGEVEASTLTHDGKVVSFQSLGGGQMFGEMAALDEKPRSTSVITTRETAVLRMAGTRFTDLVANDARLARRTLLRLCELARHLCEKAYEPRAYSVPIQILAEILRELRPHEDTTGSIVIKPAPTHQSLAERVGTNREQVTRVLRELAREGLLEQARRAWIIADVQALLRYLRRRR